jgi:hypothetical protein
MPDFAARPFINLNKFFSLIVNWSFCDSGVKARSSCICYIKIITNFLKRIKYT